MSPPGATRSSSDHARQRLTPDSADNFFLPNFCDPRIVLAVVLVGELLALAITLLQPVNAAFYTELARVSVFMQWVGLTSAGILCALRNPLRQASTPTIALTALGLLMANISIISVATVWLGRVIGAGQLEIFPSEAGPFLARNLIVGLIVIAPLLRYFFVSHQWRLHVEAEARSRIDALQARIHPHFLFNSMNTIASLTRSDPARAEEAVEDLADLFRATLGDAGRLLSLKEELELTRIYQRIEELRLGDRLSVAWDVSDLPMRARLPGLTIQPLLENAIYHGIEPLDGGGTVQIGGRCANGMIEISVLNPVDPAAGDDAHRGNRIAVANIRERLELAFNGRGSLEVARASDSYQVSMRFPVI
jgi:two-component system sensor histidine kinase AlgZ